jgi:hypothetical protein
LLYFRIEADVARRERRDERCVEQFPDALAGDRCVIADDGEFGFPLPDQFVQQAFRRPDSHEAADHDGCAIGDQGNGFLRRLSSCELRPLRCGPQAGRLSG